MSNGWEDLGERRAPLLDLVTQGAVAGGFNVLVLRGPGPHTEPWTSKLNILDLLVHPDNAPSVIATLRATDWRYELGTLGVQRLFRSAAFLYDLGPALYVYWGIPFSPLPSRLLRRLEEALWDRTRRTERGWTVPRTEPLLMFLAVQAARGGRLHRQWDWEQFKKSVASLEDTGPLHELARDLRMTGLLRTSLERAEADKDRPARPAFDGPWGSLLYRTANGIRTRAPHGIRMLAKTAEPGDVACITCFGGVEIRSAPPAFCPMHTTESFLPPAEGALAGSGSPVVVDAGTGAGAVALAIATRYPGAEIHGTDIGKTALRWARRNARRLGLSNVAFHEGSLTDPLPAHLRGRVDVLFANLPYYPAKKYVPVGSIARDAIQGTHEDGLGLYRELARAGTGLLRGGGRLITQMFGWQWDYFAGELEALGYQPRGRHDREPFVIGWADLGPHE